MKFFSILLIVAAATSTAYASAIPEAAPEALAYPGPEARPEQAIRRATCTRKLAWWPDKHGVCVDTTKPGACKGGELYKANCSGAKMYCCIL